MQHIVLYSGGPDSLITYHRATQSLSRGDSVTPMYFNLGHRYAKQEMNAVKHTVPNTMCSDSLYGLGLWEESDSYIHHRNAFLILGASKYFEEKGDTKGSIWITVQKDELSIPDRHPRFFTSMENTLECLGQRVKIILPWIQQDKTDMVEWYLENRGDVDRLTNTWSCYAPRSNPNRHCGNCPACFRRAVAFGLNGIFEAYLEDPFKSPIATVYRKRAEDGVYSEGRCQRILEALS